MKVSIVIVCMNRPDNLYPCLKSIDATTTVEHETLVVAYLYDKAGLEQARKDFPDVTFIVSDEIRGFSENNNLALKTAKGEYCFVLNDDTELKMPVIDRLVEDFDRVPSDAAIIIPKLLNADGSLQLLGRPPYPPLNYVRQQWHRYSEPIDNRPDKNSDAMFSTYGISGAAFLIRTDVFRELGWFDERYFFTPEDIALAHLALKKGYSIWADPKAEVVHKWKTTSSRMLSATRPAAIRGSLMYFSGGSNIRYMLLAVPVWASEYGKRIKARLQGNELKHLVYKNISRSIFTHRTPRQIFVKYYTALKKNV